jgi:hypothetical protein
MGGEEGCWAGDGVGVRAVRVLARAAPMTWRRVRSRMAMILSRWCGGGDGRCVWLYCSRFGGRGYFRFQRNCLQAQRWQAQG